MAATAAVSPTKFAASPAVELTEDAHQRIQFLSSALEISASDGEVGAVHASSGDKQNTILFVPELVFRLKMCRCSCRRRHSFHQSWWHWRIRQRGSRNKFLGMYGRTKDGADDKSSGSPSKRFKQFAESHKCLPRSAWHSGRGKRMAAVPMLRAS